MNLLKILKSKKPSKCMEKFSHVCRNSKIEVLTILGLMIVLVSSNFCDDIFSKFFIHLFSSII